MSSTNKILLAGAAVLVIGGALWFLSQDSEQIKFDPKLHTVEELRKIVHEMFVEGATMYCQKLNIIKNLKQNNELTKVTLENIKYKHR